jgi:hypothetical protein
MRCVDNIGRDPLLFAVVVFDSIPIPLIPQAGVGNSLPTTQREERLRDIGYDGGPFRLRKGKI